MRERDGDDGDVGVEGSLGWVHFSLKKFSTMTEVLPLGPVTCNEVFPSGKGD